MRGANSFDSDGIFQTANAMIARLTTVNCSLAPDCAALNRKVCSSVAHTCGKCMEGYIGISGFSNAKCSRSPLRTGSVCNLNSDCLTQVCNNGLCASSSKSCPHDCAGQGVCQFYDWNGLLTLKCDSENLFCRARCSCMLGWYGEDCSKSFLEYNTTVAMKEELCVATHNTVLYQVRNVRDR